MHLPALTSLRFVAAIMVVLSHLTFLEKSGNGTVSWIQSNIFKEGYIGVTFFFVLSGFILAHSYDCRFKAKAITKWQFLRARIARIVPLHVLTFVVGICIILQVSDSIWISHFIAVSTANLTLIHSFVPDLQWYFSVNSPSWSISVEMFFYILFPLLITLRTRYLLIFGIGIAALKFGLLIWPQTSTHFIQYVFPPLRLADFVLGIVAYRLSQCYQAYLKARVRELQTGSVIFLVLTIISSYMFSQAVRYDLYYVIPMCLIVVAFSLQVSSPWKWLENKRFLLLGEASFALYMVHYLVILTGEYVRSSLFGEGSSSYAEISAVTYVVASIAISIILHSYFELPAKNVVLRLLAGVRTRSAAI
ncbi:acyltransferase [Massilia sp. IC2-477]|uniref:acyltransferase family protein n=1 Tax=Massilia sp. IC2-477 TaxID=2887198 RepID=UPI001D104838|nr:acyltransferase [Massilia sp. IC2-477]MCC2956055.1 acyltransferase [Massilia sp. IC2-477]